MAGRAIAIWLLIAALLVWAPPSDAALLCLGSPLFFVFAPLTVAGEPLFEQDAPAPATPVVSRPAPRAPPAGL